jgi:hypothetical protein
MNNRADCFHASFPPTVTLHLIDHSLDCSGGVVAALVRGIHASFPPMVAVYLIDHSLDCFGVVAAQVVATVYQRGWDHSRHRFSVVAALVVAAVYQRGWDTVNALAPRPLLLQQVQGQRRL